MSAKPLFPLLALVLVGVSLHGPARAGVISVPSPANCSKPSRIVLTGETLSGAPDPYGEFSVTVRDLANLAVTGSLVIVDFTDAPSVKVPTDQSDPAIQWQHSYRTKDKLFCVYLAADESLIRQHAELSGFPATAISEVSVVIDPTTASRSV